MLLCTALDCLPRRFWEQLKSPDERADWARATLLSQRVAQLSICFADRFPAWRLDGSAVRSHPNADRWLCRHGCGHVDATGSCWPNELEFAHSVGIRRIHSVQPADERWSTTFTLAPVLFPTQLRGTAGGFAAAVAKLGATLGVFLLPILKEKFGVPSVLGIISVVSLPGLVVTLIL